MTKEQNGGLVETLRMVAQQFLAGNFFLSESDFELIDYNDSQYKRDRQEAEDYIVSAIKRYNNLAAAKSTIAAMHRVEGKLTARVIAALSAI